MSSGNSPLPARDSEAKAPLQAVGLWRPGDVAAVGDEEDQLVGKRVRRSGERIDGRQQLPEGERKRPAGAQQTAERVLQALQLVRRHRPGLRIEPEHAAVQRIGQRRLRPELRRGGAACARRYRPVGIVPRRKPLLFSEDAHPMAPSLAWSMADDLAHECATVTIAEAPLWQASGHLSPV